MIPSWEADGVRFAVHAPDAQRLWLCLFDAQDREIRHEMTRDENGSWRLHVPGLATGARYGLRADGRYDPSAGFWFDPAKLLLDPYAPAIDRPFVHQAALAAPREAAIDTAPLMPKGIVTQPLAPLAPLPPLFAPGGLIYELNVRGFTKLHPAVPPDQRGTIGALGHPAVIAHLRRLHVGAVELMPIHAWIDERHLSPLGLSNAWGYNPVNWFALDPRLAPGGMDELRNAVTALHDAGIGVIIDMVFNHSGESDAQGTTLSLRGLDPRAAFRTDAGGRLINDTGTGNSIDCNHPAIRPIILESLRHLVRSAGVDGFRFDLAPALGRMPHGFDAQAPLLREMRDDPLLRDRIMIAEPWDLGPGGYQLGGFGAGWLEWNDQYRDDMRRFWRGDDGMIGRFATRLAGSSDIFPDGLTRTVNFLAAHDGFPLADLTAYASRHNEANGEQNRDGHDANLSWNSGTEGESDNPAIVAARRRDVRALLSTLFCSRGTIMLCAGDEFGRTQGGNNNAYAQDNAISWIDWQNRDRGLEAHAFALAAFRARHIELRDATLLRDEDVDWLDEEGAPLSPDRWDAHDRRCLTLRFCASGLAVCVNGSLEARHFKVDGQELSVGARSLCFLERRGDQLIPAID